MKAAPIRDVARLVGQLEAEESVAIRPELEGIVEEILFVVPATYVAFARLVERSEVRTSRRQVPSPEAEAGL